MHADVSMPLQRIDMHEIPWLYMQTLCRIICKQQYTCLLLEKKAAQEAFAKACHDTEDAATWGNAELRTSFASWLALASARPGAASRPCSSSPSA